MILIYLTAKKIFFLVNFLLSLESHKIYEFQELKIEKKSIIQQNFAKKYRLLSVSFGLIHE